MKLHQIIEQIDVGKIIRDYERENYQKTIQENRELKEKIRISRKEIENLEKKLSTYANGEDSSILTKLKDKILLKKWRAQWHYRKGQMVEVRCGDILKEQHGYNSVKYRETINFMQRQEFEKALELDPDNTIFRDAIVVSYKKLSSFYEEKKVPTKAIAVLKKALELNPNDAELYSSIGYICSELGIHTYAKKAYKKALELDPNHAEAWIKRGINGRAYGFNQRAIEAYKKALGLKPDDAFVRCCLGAVYDGDGQYQEAIDYYKKSLELKPDDARTWGNLGIAYNNNGQYKKAAGALRRSIELDPYDKFFQERLKTLEQKLIEEQNKVIPIPRTEQHQMQIH